MNAKKRIWAVLLSICAITFTLLLPLASGKVEAATVSGNLGQQLDLSGSAITQDSQDILISEVQVTLEIPKVGAENGTISVSGGDAYTVTASRTEGWEGPSGDPADRFINGDEYRAVFMVEAKEGYMLSAETKVLVNGSEEGVELVGGLEIPASQFDFKCYPECIDTITQITLTDVPLAVEGEIAEDYVYLDPEERFEVTGTWYRYDVSAGQYVGMTTGSELFENGNIYELLLFIDPEDGYLLDPDCLMSVNDIEYEFLNWELEGELRIPVSFATEVTQVQIPVDAVPEAVIGEVFQDVAISIPLIEGSGATASGYWTYIDEKGEEHRAGTFENGKAYYFYLNIVPEAGYSLSENLEIRIGEEENWPDECSASMATITFRSSFIQLIGETELINLPVATIGELLPTGIFQVEVPEEENYTAEAWWMYYNAEMDEWTNVDEAKGTHKVQSGNIYRLSVQMSPTAGHEFADVIQMKAYGVLHQPANVTPFWVLWERDFSFRQQIDHAEVNGMTAPTIGSLPVVEGLTVPTDAHYTIAEAKWYDADDISSVTVFEAGHSYFLELVLKPENGYEFQNDVIALLNGEKAETSPNDSLLYMRREISFKNILTEIRIDNVPEMKIGETAVAEVKMPEGAKYSAHVLWNVWNEKRELFEPFDGIFETGKIYNLYIHIIPDSGYRFDRGNTVFLINGSLCKDILVRDSIAYYRKEYSTGRTAIDRIELQVSAPVTGHHASVKPVVKLPGDANYELADDTFWLEGNIGHHWSIQDDYFTEAGNYGVFISLFAKEGYRFSENPTIIINGMTPVKGNVEVYQHHSSIRFFFRYKSAIEMSENFMDTDISQELKDAGFDTVSKIEDYMKAAINQINDKLENTKLYNATLMYTNDGGVTWHNADEIHFPMDGKLQVSLKVPEGTNLADYNYTILHMFSNSAFGKIPGSIEQPEVTERTDADGAQYLDFYVTGLSPILLGWEKEKIESGEQQPGNPGGGESGEQQQTDNTDREEAPETKESGDSITAPNTGDNSTVIWWFIMSLISLAGLLVVLRAKISKE